MQLMPPIQEIEAQRGRTTTFTLSVKNIGDEDTPSRFEAFDMDISLEGLPEIADSTIDIADSLAVDSTLVDSLEALLWKRGCGKWITLDPPEAYIKAHESIKLTGTIDVPMDADGSYYAMIRGSFITSDHSSDDEDQLIKIESQAGVVVLVTIPSSRNRALIYPDTILVYPMGEAEDNPMFGSGHEPGWSVVLPVKNDGNVHTKVSGSVSFWTASGTKIEAAELKAGQGYALPGRIRNFRADGSDFLTDGYFMLRINLRSEMGMNTTKSFPFAIYDGDVYPGALSDELTELLRTAIPSFRLKQPFFSRDVSAGGSSFMAIQMQSVVEDTITLVPRMADWTLSEGGGAVLTDQEDVNLRSCKSWLDLTESEFELLPGRKKSFKMRINVPQDVAGEYYAAIVFDLDSTRLDIPDEFMSDRTQLIALATTQGIEAGIDVDSIEIEVLRDPTLTLHRFHFKVHNIGNAHCFAKGNMSLEKEIAKGLYDPVGTAKEFGNPNLYILPDGERSYVVDVPNLEPGKYRSVLAVNYKSGEQPVVKYQVYEIE